MTKPTVPAAGTTRPAEDLLDAAERLLIREGHAAISTRRVAEEAGLNHGLVHYYFGSIDELLVQVLERFTQRLIERQREMYALDVPFIEKWRTAMIYLDADEASGYQKLWLELQALSWNRPELRERVASVNAMWREVVTEAFTVASRDYGIEADTFPVPAIVSLVMTFNQGLILEGLCGVREGRDELLDAIDRWLMSLEGGSA
ncbi:MAG: TetR family transcriptional regulator [Actinomycetota bacterium]|nr:TetR family transcriptional regulator [Actinomycetota bacterium]